MAPARGEMQLHAQRGVLTNADVRAMLGADLAQVAVNPLVHRTSQAATR